MIKANGTAWTHCSRAKARVIAAALNDRGIATPRGGQWQSMTVIRLLDRLGL